MIQNTKTALKTDYNNMVTVSFKPENMPCSDDEKDILIIQFYITLKVQITLYCSVSHLHNTLSLTQDMFSHPISKQRTKITAAWLYRQSLLYSEFYSQYLN